MEDVIEAGSGLDLRKVTVYNIHNTPDCMYMYYTKKTSIVHCMCICC